MKVSTLRLAGAEILHGAVGDRVGIGAGALQGERAEIARRRRDCGLEGGLSGVRRR